MITRKIRSGNCLAQVNGDMTIYTAAECHGLLQQCLESGAEIEIDLSGVTDIDSAGMQLLIATKKAGARLGKPVRLISHSSPVQEIIDLYRLASEFGDLMIMPSR